MIKKRDHQIWLSLICKKAPKTSTFSGLSYKIYILLLIKQIPDSKHYLIGGVGTDEVLIGGGVALAIDKVVGVLAILVGQQGVARHLLEDTPVLTKEVREVQDVHP